MGRRDMGGAMGRRADGMYSGDTGINQQHRNILRNVCG